MPLALKIYNTLSRQLETLEPKEPGKLGVYCCGPTVYDVPHAGHARSAVAFDVFVRHVRESGVDVNYVRNITDVEDKILNRAKENGEEPLALSQRMTLVYQEDMAAIGCEPPNQQPKVSDHLPQIYEMIERLIANDAAYVLDRDDGKRDVYFAVRKFKTYGGLSRRKIDDLRSGARVEADQAKRDPLDFALWKGTTSEDWGWESPWGPGRPGWHIECSAMSCCYLGHDFDVHAGGMDLIFPHHENEIAQSEASTDSDRPMARYWMHNGFVNIDKEKMSKSLGNFVTVRDVLARNDPEGFRWFLLTVHYRGPLQFDSEKLDDGRVVFPGVDEAEGRVDYLYSVQSRLAELVALENVAPKKEPPEIVRARQGSAAALKKAIAALNDDLNTAVCLAELGELAKLGNDLCDLAKKRRKDAAFCGAASVQAAVTQAAIKDICGHIGLMWTPHDEYKQRSQTKRLALRGLQSSDMDAKVAARNQARADKDFARSDEIRDELAALGVSLKDAPEGTVWSIEV